MFRIRKHIHRLDGNDVILFGEYRKVARLCGRIAAYIDHPFGVLADTAEPLVELNREQRELLQYVKNNPGAKTGDVADQFHLSESSAKRRLNELKCLDLVSYRGSRGFDSGYYATSTKDI